MVDVLGCVIVFDAHNWLGARISKDERGAQESCGLENVRGRHWVVADPMTGRTGSVTETLQRGACPRPSLTHGSFATGPKGA